MTETETLLKLWRNYTVIAWPFMLAHLVCLLFVVRGIYDLWHERLRLNGWVPRKTPADPSEGAVAMLDEFVASVRQLGPKGGSINIGEHLDRVQDMIARMETHLSDAIHSFLLIGIAGTLFGLFQFAVKVDAGNGAVVSIVTTELPKAMGLAFPVGFVGVVLLVTFQLVSSFFERGLNDAVNGATARALEFRRMTTVAETDFIDAVRTSISTSMKPLQDLGALLELSLEPIIKDFGARLDQSVALVREQMDILNGYASGIASVEQKFVHAASQVEKTTEALATFTKTFSKRLDAIETSSKALQQQSEATIRWSTDLIALSKAQGEKIDTERRMLDVTLDQAAAMTDKVLDVVESISKTTAEVSALPPMLAKAVSEAIPPIVEGAGRALLVDWKDSTREMAGQLRDATDKNVANVVRELERVSARLDKTLKQWDQVSANVETLVRDAIQQAVRNGNQETERLLTSTADVVHAMVTARKSTAQQLTDAVGGLSGLVTQWRDETAVVVAELRAAAAEIHQAAASFRPSFDQMVSQTGLALQMQTAYPVSPPRENEPQV